VQTLAHEIGHAVHMWMAYEAQGHLMQDTPLTLDETASCFGEDLVFRKLLARIKSPSERKAMLMQKIENGISGIEVMIQNVDFEREVHNRQKKQGDMDIEEFSALWLEKLKERTGPDFAPGSGQEHDWSRLPYFFTALFYVYSYAFGESLVESLVEARQEGRIDDFEQKYLEMLKAGGTKHHKELLAPFGLDASQPDFWQKGFEVRSRRIDELERLVQNEKAALAALEGVKVTKTRGKDQYMLEVLHREDEAPDGYDTRSQGIADTLGVALGYEVKAHRGMIQLARADGVVAEKLDVIASRQQHGFPPK
jgi:oligoendopeptidase F